MDGMSRTVQVTFDGHDPRAQAEFWGDLLGYLDPERDDGGVIGDAANDHCAIADPGRTGPRLHFQRVPEQKVVKNRVHLDVRVAAGLRGHERMAALDAESGRLVARGARQLRRFEPATGSPGYLIMADPEGNEFCLD